MSTSDVEYEAVSYLAKADRRYRSVVYALTLVFFAILTFLAFAVYDGQVKQQQQTQYLLNKISDITKQRLQETQIQNEQTRRYITCLFVLPIADRTQAAQQKCAGASTAADATFDPAATSSAASSDTTSAVPSPVSANSAQENSSSSDTAPVASSTQPDNSQQPGLIEQLLQPTMNTLQQTANGLL